MKDDRLVKQEAGNDAGKKKEKKREVGQRSEGRNVTAICDMWQERKEERARGKMATAEGGGAF